MRRYISAFAGASLLPMRWYIPAFAGGKPIAYAAVYPRFRGGKPIAYAAVYPREGGDFSLSIERLFLTALTHNRRKSAKLRAAFTASLVRTSCRWSLFRRL